MSAEFGALGFDVRHVERPDRDDRDDEPDQLAERGAWPEEMDDIGFYADSALTIPGQAEPPGDCGTWGPREFCAVCGEVEMGPHKCQRRICEDCWLTWRGQRAGAVMERLAGARRAADGAEKRLSHCVASPPEGEVKTLVEFEQAKRKAYALAKEKGIRGGVLIPHGWRPTDEAKRAFRELDEAGLTDGGIWRWIREHERSWRSLAYWSPHFHILGLGADLDESDPDGDDGWIWSRIDSFERFNLTDEETYRPMFKAASYLLSHGAFEAEEGKQMIRWFGSLANNQFSVDGDLADWEASVIRRNVEAVTGILVEDGDGPAAERECEEDGCSGALVAIFDAGEYLLDPRWCDEIGREQERKLSAAFEWAIGDLDPPPGMKGPRSREQALEVLETLL